MLRILFFFIVSITAFDLLAVETHPRLHLDSRRIAQIREKAATQSDDFLRLKTFLTHALQASPGTLAHPCAVILSAASLTLATNDTSYRDGALRIYDWVLLNQRLGDAWPAASTNPEIPAGDFAALLDYADEVYRFALATDWLYGSLSDDRLSRAQQFLQEYCNAAMSPGEWTINSGSPWSAGAIKWMVVLSAAGLCFAPGQPWDGYADQAHGKLQAWMDQLCKRFADGGGSIEETGTGHLQVNVSRMVDMLWTASGVDESKRCSEYFDGRSNYLLQQIHYWDGGQGLFPARGGDFLQEAKNHGYSGNDDLLEELWLLQKWGRNADASRSAFAMDRLQMKAVDGARLYVEFCFRDSSVAPAPESEMPLSHYASGTGEIIARESWSSEEAPSAAFFCGGHRSNRMHLDQNSVQLSGYGGELLIDSGNSDHLTEPGVDGYSARTVAHNTILIEDPTELFNNLKIEKTYPPDGGQRGFSGGDGPDLQSISAYRENKDLYGTGKIIRFEDADSYVYALGDATNAYNNPEFTSPPSNLPKCLLYQRDFLFLRPATRESETYLVLFDRVEVPVERREDLGVKSLFHFLHEPAVDGTPTRLAGRGSSGIWRYLDAEYMRATDSNGQVFLQSLLPVSCLITKIGGPNFEQYSGDRNYPADNIFGGWRVEIESPLPSSKTYFLAVVSPDDKTRNRAVAAEVLQTEGRDITGAFIMSPRMSWVLVFNRRTDGAAPEMPIRYRYAPSSAQRHIICGLVPGSTYSVDAIDVDSTEIVTITAGGPYAASQAGVLAFGLSRHTYVTDTTPPTGSVTVNGGGSYTSSPAVFLMLNAQDSQSGMIPGGAFSISNDSNNWSGPFPYTQLARWALSPGDGGKALYVKYRDAAGNWSQPVVDTIILTTSGAPTDKSIPAGTLSLNNGDAVTEDQNASLQIGGTDNDSGIGPASLMQFSNDGQNWTTPEAFSISKDWELSDGKGAKIVYARITDQAGNWSSAFSSSITLQ